MNGDHARSRPSCSRRSPPASPTRSTSPSKALSEAIGAGQMDLALSLARTIPAAKLPTDARLLLVADEVRRRRPDARAAVARPSAPTTATCLSSSPLVTAWDAADRGDADAARWRRSTRCPANSLLGPLRDEETALILLKFRRTAEAEPFARRAIGVAGAREDRLRLALADGFLAAGDRARALIMLDGMGAAKPRRASGSLAGKPSGQAIDTSAKALSEVLTAFAADLARLQRGGAADRAGPGRALRRSARTAARPRCWPCCSRGRTARTRRWRCSARSRATMR